MDKISMRCQHCGFENEKSAIFCGNCGKKIIYASNASKKSKSPSSKNKEKVEDYSNVQPIWQFALLCLITFSLYQIYWFYKKWEYIRERESSDIIPILRALFAIIFAYSLFKKTKEMAQEKDYLADYSPGWIFFTFVILSFLVALPEPLWLISLLSFLPLISILKTLNYYWQQEQPDLPVKTNLSIGEIAIVIIGGIFWSLFLMALFIE